jgi:Rrf2 family protein
MLSQTCEYALRAVTYIGRHTDAGPVLAKDIATEMEVPLRYLQKVLRDLVRIGVLDSTRGIGGGFRLSRPADKVRLTDVMAPFDDILARTSCPFGNPQCGKANPCPVHDRWADVAGAYLAFLQNTTVRDLLGKR